MNFMKKQTGYTLLELFMLLWGLICLSAVGLVIWAAIHFIHKFW